ncbi:NUDIX hydrolase [Scopulibacillus cellulosilyticus]|uniref:NUDIX hydrolase n=1 Tax=Scopulibacillus cellulosilyticus TaxID=2665665 RepID=A0ABW2PZW7_9BACL
MDQIITAAGTVILNNDAILLVKEHGKWGLPKGGQEPNESLINTAVRETREETGLDVLIKGLAFMSEFFIEHWGHYLQVYYEAKPAGGKLNHIKDFEVDYAEYIPLDNIEEYLHFPPVINPLKAWLKDRQSSYYLSYLNEDGKQVPPNDVQWDKNNFKG